MVFDLLQWVGKLRRTCIYDPNHTKYFLEKMSMARSIDWPSFMTK